jgi:hypothetical protein
MAVPHSSHVRCFLLCFVFIFSSCGLAAHRVWFTQRWWLLITYDSFCVDGCSHSLVHSRLLAASRFWFNPNLWLLNCFVSVVGCGFFRQMVLFRPLDAHFFGSLPVPGCFLTMVL